MTDRDLRVSSFRTCLHSRGLDIGEIDGTVCSSVIPLWDLRACIRIGLVLYRTRVKGLTLKLSLLRLASASLRWPAGALFYI